MCALDFLWNTKTTTKKKIPQPTMPNLTIQWFFRLTQFFPVNLYSSFSFCVPFRSVRRLCLFGGFPFFAQNSTKTIKKLLSVKQTYTHREFVGECKRLSERKVASERERERWKTKSQKLWRQIKPTTPGKACQRNHHRLISSNKNVTDDIHYLWICDILLRILVRKMAITRACH